MNRIVRELSKSHMLTVARNPATAHFTAAYGGYSRQHTWYTTQTIQTTHVNTRHASRRSHRQTTHITDHGPHKPRTSLTTHMGVEGGREGGFDVCLLLCCLSLERIRKMRAMGKSLSALFYAKAPACCSLKVPNGERDAVKIVRVFLPCLIPLHIWYM